MTSVSGPSSALDAAAPDDPIETGVARPDRARPGRPSHLLVVTPWYPTDEKPYLGTFVRQSVRAVAPHVAAVTILHVETRPAGSDVRPRCYHTPEGRVHWIPVPLPADTGRGGTMLAHRRAMAEHAGPLLRSASLVHCHVGSPSAGALVQVLRTEAHLVVTEHATYLPSVFRDPLARRWYRAALRRAQVFAAVSRPTAELIESSFPLDRVVQTIPNPVDMTALPEPTAARSRPWPTLARWLYVGNLVPHKGVRRLVRAFAAWHALVGQPTAQLTLAGDGPLLAELTALATDLGVGERVEVLGAVPPEAMGSVYAQHDLLVHLSRVETFGLTCVEAAASGLAVVVTDCGAPTQTLAVHAALGLAEVVPVAGDGEVQDVVSAVARLCDGLAEAEGVPDRLRVSRQHLERCYGSAAVGARLAAALGLPGTSGRQPSRGDPELVAVAVTPGQLAAAERALWDVHDLGGTGHLVTTAPPEHPLPPGVSVDLPALATGTARWRREVESASIRLPTALWDGLDAVARITARIIPGRQRSQRVLLGLGRRIEGVRVRSAHAVAGPRYALRSEFRLRGSTRYARDVAQVRATLLGLDLTGVDLIQAPDTVLDRPIQDALAAHPSVEVQPEWSRHALAEWWVRHLPAPE